MSSDFSSQHRPFWIFPAIIISQFAGTSLWFATNAVLPDLQQTWRLDPDSVGIMTSAVQFGFILGTLLFAFFMVTDRFSPRILFAVSSFAGALFNLGLYFFPVSFSSLFVLRFFTGACLAGIYPVGMKIASGWYREGLGNALGFLVGALVLGTSFPHLLKSLGHLMQWETVIISISVISASGGMLMMVFVPDGPYLSKGTPFSSKALVLIFQSRELRSAAFGYFGHMWELYTFYTFVPFALSAYCTVNHYQNFNIAFWSFAIIAAGSIGCSVGGIFSQRVGSARIAWLQLFCSGVCCLCSPLFFKMPPEIFLVLFIFWGMVVVGDSPQFSALVAKYAPQELVGSALTVSNSIGFAITIVSIEIASYLSHVVPAEYIFSFLTIGPLAGLLWLSRITRMNKNEIV